MRIQHILFTLIFGLCALFPVAQTYAAVDLGMEYAAESGLTNTDPRNLTARIIGVSLGFLGILTTCIILYAGFKWMTAGGNEDQITEAKKLITSAVIGLLIIMSSWAITNFVFKSLYQATTGNQLLE